MRDNYLHIDHKQLAIKLKWVPSHLADECQDGDFASLVIPGGNTLEDILGNMQADKLAKAAAHSVCIECNSSARITSVFAR